MKKIFVPVIIALCAAMILASCGPKEPAAEEKVTLRFASLTEGANGDPVITKLAEHAAEVNNVNIVYEPTPGGWFEFFQKMMAQVAANDVPDYIRMRTGDLPYLAENNYIVDLGPKISQLSRDDYYLEYFMFFAGKQVAVPPGIYSANLWYNRDMLAKAGIPEPGGVDDPWTFEEFRAAAKALTTGEGQDKVYGYSSNWDGGRWASFVWGNGADFYDAAGKPTYNTPLFKETFQMFVDMILVDKSMPNISATQAITPRDLFMAQKVAMYSSGQWDVVNWNTLKDFKVGVTIPPYNPNNPGAESTVGLFIDAYSVMSGSKHQDLAFDAIMSMVDEEGCRIQTEGGIFGWPINKKFAEANRDKLFVGAIDRAQIDTLMGFGAKTRPYGFLIDEVQQAFMKYFQLMSLGEISVSDGLDAVQSESINRPVNVIGLNY